MKLSVAIATFNEEENLGPCLDSVKDWVDEIVIVDGSSTDRTVEIAKKYGAKIIVTDNPAIFHINKQKAIDACQGEWILQLDADERISKELRQEILKVVNSKTKFNGFWLPRKNFFLGRYLKKGGQYPDYTLRLYRKGKGHLPCVSVHEQAEVEGKVGYLKNDLLHQVVPNFRCYLLRFSRYTDLIADELTEKKLNLNLLNGINYLLIKPFWWFFWTYFRHKGFVDGWQGFVFSFFSGFRFAVGYLKYWRKKGGRKKQAQDYWKKYWRSQDHQPQVVHKELLKNLEKVIEVKGKKILEIGAGMGGDSLYLAKRGAKITVLDFVPEALKKIKASAEKERVNLKTVLADARKIPFKNGSFDVVFHQGFLEHFRNPEPYLKEQKRVLKKNGFLVVDVPQRFTTYTVKKHLQMWQGRWFAGWEREFSIRELENLLKKSGFEIIKSYGWGYYGKLYKLRHLKLGQWYQLIWKKIESGRLKLYLSFSIGVVARKK